jgi:non-specific serine/threonine protein kinase
MSLMDAHTAKSLLDFAESVGPTLRGSEANAVFAQFEQQYSDLMTAMQWFTAHGHTDESLRLASALVAFWMATKRLAEGSGWFDQALALPGGDDAYRGRAFFDAGYLAFWMGDDQRATALHNRAVELGRQSNNVTVIALSLVGLARLALRSHDVDTARRLCREALAVTEGSDDRSGRSSAMHVLGVAAQMAGDLLEAREVMSQRIALGREMGNLVTVSIESGNLSMVERQLGNLDRAEALAREALDIDFRRADELSIPWKVNALAAVAKDRGEFDRAAALIGIADATMEASGGAWPPDELVHYEQTVTALTQAMGMAEFERVRAWGRSMTTPEGVRFALGPGFAGQGKAEE